AAAGSAKNQASRPSLYKVAVRAVLLDSTCSLFLEHAAFSGTSFPSSGSRNQTPENTPLQRSVGGLPCPLSSSRPHTSFLQVLQSSLVPWCVREPKTLFSLTFRQDEDNVQLTF
ncbi:unnamed protein product, partial [Ectocarpus sp. 4 AP-2014]